MRRTPPAGTSILSVPVSGGRTPRRGAGAPTGPACLDAGRPEDQDRLVERQPPAGRRPGPAGSGGFPVSRGGRVCWSTDGRTKRVSCGGGGTDPAARAAGRCGPRAGVGRRRRGAAADARGVGRRVRPRPAARPRGPRLRAEVRRHPHSRRGDAVGRSPRRRHAGGAGGPHLVPAGQRQDRAVSRDRGRVGRARGATPGPCRARRRDRGRRRRRARAAVRTPPGTHAPVRPAPPARARHRGRADGVRPDSGRAGGPAPAAADRSPGPSRRAPRSGRRRVGADRADPGRRWPRPARRGDGPRLGGADRQGPRVEVPVGPTELRVAEAQARAAAGVRRRRMDRGPLVAQRIRRPAGRLLPGRNRGRAAVERARGGLGSRVVRRLAGRGGSADLRRPRGVRFHPGRPRRHRRPPARHRRRGVAVHGGAPGQRAAPLGRAEPRRRGEVHALDGRRRAAPSRVPGGAGGHRAAGRAPRGRPRAPRPRTRLRP